jgi:hypothetical protein
VRRGSTNLEAEMVVLDSFEWNNISFNLYDTDEGEHYYTEMYIAGGDHYILDMEKIFPDSCAAFEKIAFRFNELKNSLLENEDGCGILFNMVSTIVETNNTVNYYRNITGA